MGTNKSRPFACVRIRDKQAESLAVNTTQTYVISYIFIAVNNLQNITNIDYHPSTFQYLIFKGIP